MPLDQMAKIYRSKTKTLFPYEYFGLDSYDSEGANGRKATYDNFIGNLKIEDFKSSLFNKLPTQEEADICNNENRDITGRDFTIEFLENDVNILDYGFNYHYNLIMEEFGLNPLHYASLIRCNTR